MSAKQIIFGIEGMSCGGCRKKVENNLRKTAGVENAAVDLEQKKAIVTGTVDYVVLAKVVEALGFKAQRLQTASR
ncbi:MAG TPA: heavy metal-associated domain-containing protein [Patescibacteria group bacterium]|nr:heavy metal-associated domain-containing protein [Patescibacteria group bacterium]